MILERNNPLDGQATAICLAWVQIMFLDPISDVEFKICRHYHIRHWNTVVHDQACVVDMWSIGRIPGELSGHFFQIIIMSENLTLWFLPSNVVFTKYQYLTRLDKLSDIQMGQLTRGWVILFISNKLRENNIVGKLRICDFIMIFFLLKQWKSARNHKKIDSRNFFSENLNEAP